MNCTSAMHTMENSSWMVTYWPAEQATFLLTKLPRLLLARQVLFPEHVTPALEVTALRSASTVTQTLSRDAPFPQVLWYIKLYAPFVGHRNPAASWIKLAHQTPLLEWVTATLESIVPLRLHRLDPSLHATELPAMARSWAGDRHG